MCLGCHVEGACQWQHVFKCIIGAVMSSLVQPPQPTLVNTHSPSSSCGSTGQLSLLLVSADGLRRDRGGAGGAGGSTAEQMQKPLLGLLRTDPFPATPQPCSCPGTSCPRRWQRRAPDTSSLRRVVENPSELLLYSLTVQVQMTFCEHPPTPVSTPDKTCLETHSSPFDLWPPPLNTMSPMITQHKYNGGNTFTFIWGQITVQIHIKGFWILQAGVFSISKALDVQPARASHNDSLKPCNMQLLPTDRPTGRTYGCLWWWSIYSTERTCTPAVLLLVCFDF